MQVPIHGDGTDTVRDYFSRLLQRVRFYRFFFLPPLYLALPFFLPRLREFRFVWVAAALLIFSPGRESVSVLLPALHCRSHVPMRAGDP